MDYGAIGTVTNLAARLCGEAIAGQILVPGRVAAAVEDIVEGDDMGPVTLKGLARPVSVWSVRGLRYQRRQGSRAATRIRARGAASGVMVALRRSRRTE